MSKKDKNMGIENPDEMMDGVQAGVTPSVDEQAVSDKDKRFKEKKAEAAKRFKERRKEEAIARVDGAQKLIAQLKADGLWDKLGAEHKDFLSGIANPVSNAAHNNGGLLCDLFGNPVAVGASITLDEAFQKTLKGKATIDKYVKDWAKKGIVVTYEQNKEKLTASTYTLVSINKAE